MNSNTVSIPLIDSKTKTKYYFIIIFLFALFFLNSSLSSQIMRQNEADWQIFLGDSLIISCNLGVKYSSAQSAIIDIEKCHIVKDLTIVHKTFGAYEAIIDFKENSTSIFTFNKRFYRSQRQLDTLIIKSEYFVNELRSLKGKTVRVFYSDDKFQTTPTLLGTLIVKND